VCSTRGFNFAALKLSQCFNDNNVRRIRTRYLWCCTNHERPYDNHGGPDELSSRAYHERPNDDNGGPNDDNGCPDAKEQKPVWEAFKSDLEGREAEADISKGDVTKAISAVGTATDNLAPKSKKLKETSLEATGDPKVALGQSANIDEAEELIRKTEAALADLKMKVATLMGDSKNLEKKIKEAEKKRG